MKTEEVKDEKEQVQQEKKGPKQSDWRWGPAQYWYDMLELPEDVSEYDYGLKVRSAEEQRQVDDAVANISGAEINPSSRMKSQPEPSTSSDTNQDSEQYPKVEYPPDAFHMVTQLNWEEDVIWNGEDIKHKVLAKLNSKSNAAGWVPSSMSRTAGSFSQRPGVSAELQIRLATLGKMIDD